MLCGADFGCSAAGETPGFAEFRGIQEFTAIFALVSPGIVVAAGGTVAADKPVSEKTLAGGAVQLLDGMFPDVSVFFKIEKKRLGNLGLLGS